jgi:arylsulfatase A-like enzyme
MPNVDFNRLARLLRRCGNAMRERIAQTATRLLERCAAKLDAIPKALRCWAAAAAVAAAVLIAAGDASAQGQPNVVVILADDMGWSDANTFGSDYYQTENLDALRNQSALLEQFLACPNCAPARARLLAGMYEGRTKMYAVGNPNRGEDQYRQLDGVNQDHLDTAVVTVAESLQTAGYATGHFGKWHLSSASGGADPTGQGFDVNIGGSSGGGGAGAVESHFADASGNYQDLSGTDLPNLTGDPGDYLADRVTDEALAWMSTQSQPFFSYISHYAVHWPIEAKQSDIDEYDGVPPGTNHDNQTYAAMISNLDENVGRVIDYLETTDDPDNPGQKLIDDTVVWFMSDNGGVTTSPAVSGTVTSNAPLRDGKGSHYEGGMRVPSMVRWDGHVVAGGSSDVRATMLDVYPTILEMTGTAAPGGQAQDGMSVLGLLDGSQSELPRDTHYMHYPAYITRNQSGSEMRITPSSWIWRDDWKLIYTYETQSYALYDLASDPGETTNLADDNPDLVNDMREDLNAWLIDTDADLPTYKGTSQEVPLPIEFSAPDPGLIYEAPGPINLGNGEVTVVGAGDVNNDDLGDLRTLVITYNVRLTETFGDPGDAWLALGMGFDGAPGTGAQSTDVVGFNSSEESDAAALLRTLDSGDPSGKEHKLWIGGNTDPTDDVVFPDVVLDGVTGGVRITIDLSEPGILPGELADMLYEVDEDGDGIFDTSASATLTWTDGTNYMWLGSRGGGAHEVTNLRIVATPEPASLVLLVLGGGAMAIRRRR